jgi:hypothetical protein
MSNRLLEELLGIVEEPAERIGTLMDRRINPDGTVWVLVSFGGDFSEWVEESYITYKKVNISRTPSYE